MKSKWPAISIIIPTLNSASVLGSCLKSIRNQDYPGIIEIIIVDAQSSDSTLAIAQKYKTKILSNPLKTAEAAKALGVHRAKNDLVALIDSDNILPNPKWLKEMVAPLIADKKLIGSEPLSFTYRSHGGFIERYSALIGANDPYAFVSGNYDRHSYLSNRWTGLKIYTIDYPSYLKISLDPGKPLPTIGANGTIFYRNFILKHLDSPYLFDIDLIAIALKKSSSPLYFAKVKTGIIHTYCESSITKFIKKQKRRVTDLYYYRDLRRFDWPRSAFFSKNFLFGLYTLSFVFPLKDSLLGFLKKPDLAWFFHPLACYLTLFQYALVYFKASLGLNTYLNRNTWHQ